MKLIKVLSLVSLVAVASASDANALVPGDVLYPGDNGFESPDQGDPNLGATGYTEDPTGTPWTFTGSSGIVANGPGPYAKGATQGQASDSDVSSVGQAGYLQNSSSIDQDVYLCSGNYQISFDFEIQPTFTGNEITVSLGSELLYDGTPTSDTGFTPVTTMETGWLCAGSYDLVFTGIGADGASTFIDNVSLAVVPEPAHWGWMAFLGLAAAVGLRRAQRKSA